MAGQDYPKRLEPGATQNVNISGDYIFCKFADRPFTVIMDGSRVTMEGGDKYRTGKGFKEFEIENTDLERPIVIVLTIGEGDYNRQIIKGDVSVEPILRSADGTTRPDSRYDITIDLAPITLEGQSFTAGQKLSEANPGNYWESNDGSCWGPGGTIAHIHMKQGPDWAIGLYDLNYNLISITEMQNSGTGNLFGGIAWTPEIGYMAVNGNSATKISRISPGGSGFILNNDSIIRSLATDPDRGLVYVHDVNNVVTEYTGDLAPTGKIWEVVGVSNAKWMCFDRARQQFIVANTVGLYYFDRDFNQVGFDLPGVSILSVVSTKPVILNNVMWLPRGYRSDPITGDKYVIYNFTQKPTVKAIKPGCALISAKRKGVKNIQPTNLLISEIGYGLIASGEVIRGLLEYYFQATVSDDYLDHIYGLDLGMTGNGTTFKPISSGNRTFKAQGIKDNFDFLIPGRAVLKIDSTLELGSSLAIEGL